MNVRVLIVASLVLSLGPAQGATILTVCSSGCDYSSIQDAVDVAKSGEKIIIEPGVYYENVVLENGVDQVDQDAYSGGDAYLSGGGEFTRQFGTDGNFGVTSLDSPVQTIVSNIAGTGDSYNFWGQSFTVPENETQLDLAGFIFVRGDQETPSGAGIGYLFDSEYEGTPAELATASYLASGVWNGSVYDLSDAGLTLSAGTTYWFYADTPVTVGTGSSIPSVTQFELNIEGAGMGQTIIDGSNKDIVLRVGRGVKSELTGITIRAGKSADYEDGTAYKETITLINLEPVPVFRDFSELDANFEVLAGSIIPVVAVNHGKGDTTAVWGQSFYIPESAEPQQISGFRFFRGDGATPAGAGVGYLFEDSGPGLIGAVDLPTENHVAFGSWNGSVYDLSASNFWLTPGKTYWFFADTAFSAGYFDLSADRNCGGGINNRGELSIINVAIESNLAETVGGGICTPSPLINLPFPSMDGVLNVQNSLITDNETRAWNSGGGGIYAGDDTALTMAGSTVSFNRARWVGGGILAAGGWGNVTVSITDSLIASNESEGGGGGIFSGSAGTVFIQDSEITANSASYGGGIANLGGPYWVSHLQVNNSTISHNTSYSAQYWAGGGGIYNGNPGYEGYASTSVSNSVFYGNLAEFTGGGILNTGHSFEVTNSTISGNSAVTGGGLSASSGSYGTPEPVKVHSSTIAFNLGGGIDNGARVDLMATIVSNNSGGDCTGSVEPDGGSFAITSFGSNLDSDSTCLLTSIDLSGSDPLLGPLQKNSGATLSHAPMPGSPVIDPDFQGYTSGDGYLFNGIVFSRQNKSDTNFLVTTGEDPGNTIVSETDGKFSNYNVWGQSFTVPAGETNLDLTGFTFLLEDGVTPSGAGHGYLFDTEYSGTPSDLSSAAFIASGEWNGSVYDLSATTVTLVPGNSYWFYGDTALTVGFAQSPDCPPDVFDDQRKVSRPQDGNGDGVAMCDIGSVEIAGPLADADGPYLVDEGSSAVLDGAYSRDPQDSPTSLVYEWDLDYNGVDFNSTITGISVTFDAANLDGPDSRIVALRVSNSYGISDFDTADVTVSNSPPIVSIDALGPGPSRLLPGVPVALEGSFVDISQDTHTAEINWGDGTVENLGAVDQTTAIIAQHTFSSGGSYQVSLQVSDDDNGTGMASQTIEVMTLAAAVDLIVNEIDQMLELPIEPNLITALDGIREHLVGNYDGAAHNGVIDHLLSGDVIAALVKIKAAIEGLKEAEMAGAFDLSNMKTDLGLIARSIAQSIYEQAVSATYPPSKGELKQLQRIQQALQDGHELLENGQYVAAIDLYLYALKRSLGLL